MPGAVAQIDEDAAAVVAARGHPAEEDDTASPMSAARSSPQRWVRLSSTRNCFAAVEDGANDEGDMRRNITHLAIQAMRAW